MTKGYRGGMLRFDESHRPYRYFENSVNRFWNPMEIDFSQDRDNLVGAYEDVETEVIDQVSGTMKKLLAMFGAGEASVTEDIAPFAIAFDDMSRQMFISSHMYEEGKHAILFDRYWNEVINAAEESAGMEVTSPNDDRWFCPEYEELFDAEHEATARLLEEDTPENRVKAYCTYQLTAEGIIAQTGYWGITKNFRDHAGEKAELNGSSMEIPHLPGLVEGIENIRSDEGRHIGFGMSEVKRHIQNGDVEPDLVTETVGELLPLTIEIVNYAYEDLDDPTVFPIGPADAAEYTMEKHQQRMSQILDDDQDIPDLEDLVTL
ncbi:MAG: ribonucleoside-diphosphate reductase [Halobacteriota archaeon]